MADKRNEVSYYREIQSFIEEQLKSNFLSASKRNLHVFWEIGELKAGLGKILSAHPVECACAESFAKRVPPLHLDIFALITDGTSFELLILEVKLLKSAGLKEWSQLVGYCLVSGAKYGLLVNVDGEASTPLSLILSSEQHVSNIQTIVKGKSLSHVLGFMEWDSMAQCFGYSNLGAVKSLSELSRRLGTDFGEA